MNPTHITKIVMETLNSIDIQEMSLVNLIRGTFVMESDLYNLYDYSNEYHKKRGLMLMDDRVIESLFKDYIRYKPNLRQNLTEMTGMDITDPTFDIEFIKKDLETNISLMVFITYVYYSSKYSVEPENTIDSIADYYIEYYNKDANKKNFKTEYNGMFINI